jgi:hypothetical protein
MKSLLVSLLLLPVLLVVLVHGAGVAPANQTVGFNISFVSQTHQTIGNNCYNAQIRILLSWNSTGTYSVGLNNFYLYATGTNLLLSNSTNYAQPNNILQFLVLFPNVPATLILSFTGFCIPAALSGLQVWLFYFDGSNTLSTRII